MAETRKFVKDSMVYTIGEVLTKAVAFFLLPIYTRYLTQDEFGIYNLVITIWPILLILYGKGFSSFLIRGYHEIQIEQERRRFTGTILLFSLLVGVLFAVILHLFGNYIFSPLFKGVGYKPFLQFAVAIAFFKLLSTNVLALYRAERKPFRVVGLSSVYFVLYGLAAVVLVVILHLGLLGALWGQLGSLLIAGVLYLIFVSRDISFKWNSNYLKGAILFVLPLIPHELGGWAVNLSDRILIERFLSLEQLAIYSLAYQLALGLNMLITAINQAWIPFFYEIADQPQSVKELKKSTTFYFIVVIGIGLLLAMFSKEIILLMGEQKYIGAAAIFPLVIVAFIINVFYYIYAGAIFYANKTQYIPIITLCSGLVNIGLNFLLIPRYGYIAAAYTTIIAYGIMVLLSFFFSRKYYIVPMRYKTIGLISLIALAIYGISRLVPETPYYLSSIVKIALAGLFPITLIGVGIVKQQELRDFLWTLLKKK